MKYNEKNSLSRLAARANDSSCDTEIIAGTVIDPCDKMTFPIRIEGILFILVKEGEGTITIDMVKYKLKPDTLVVLHPRNYLNDADVSHMTIDVVVCSIGIVDNVLPKLSDLMPFLVQHRSAPVDKLRRADADNLREYMSFLKHQLDGKDTPFLRKKMICLLQAMLFEMMEISTRQSGLSPHPQGRRQELMAQFVLLVSEQFHTQRNVGYYADRLCVSAKHLSAVVKRVSGRTAGEWIENYVTVEAKVLLSSTDMSIQQISQRLNFPNQSFFGKYFKHHTGMSPTEYRKRNT